MAKIKILCKHLTGCLVRYANSFRKGIGFAVALAIVVGMAALWSFLALSILSGVVDFDVDEWFWVGFIIIGLPFLGAYGPGVFAVFEGRN